VSADDFVAPFSLDNAPVRGRVVRLGAGALDAVLRRHDYPRAVAMLLGEALALASLVGSLLKAEGRLIVQAQGEGAVSLLVAEHNHGALRGYARLREGAADALANANRMAPAALLGEGALVLTLEIEGEAPYQGVVTLEGETLAQCAETYFRVSEQTDTGIRLAVGEVLRADRAPEWRAGGVLMQRIAGDDARGDTQEDWRRATYLFATVTDEELLDPDLAADRLLFRLFHEEGVRMGSASGLADQCSCNAERLTAIMRSFDADELRDMVEPDGLLHARCQFCGRSYEIAPGEAGLG
jgi:molecular chaperone Hsp33